MVLLLFYQAINLTYQDLHLFFVITYQLVLVLNDLLIILNGLTKFFAIFFRILFYFKNPVLLVSYQRFKLFYTIFIASLSDLLKLLLSVY
jgi:hypothetical protein